MFISESFLMRAPEKQPILSINRDLLNTLWYTHVLSCVRLFATLWIVARQIPLSMGFSRQEHWSGLPRGPPDLPDPKIEPKSPALQVDSLPPTPPGKPQGMYTEHHI